MISLPHKLYYWEAIELPYNLFVMYKYHVELASGEIIDPETYGKSYSGAIVYLLK